MFFRMFPWPPARSAMSYAALIAVANFLLILKAKDLQPFPAERFRKVARVFYDNIWVELKDVSGSQATVQFRFDGAACRLCKRPIVAVKVFKRDERESALRELEILVLLRAQGVQRVSRLVGEGYEDDQRRVVIVTVYAGPNDLFTFVAAYGPMSEVRVCTIVRDLLTIIVDLASLRPPILHSDLKLDNIIVDVHGNIMLVDFGLAGYIGLDGTTGECNGTVTFMAPEVLRRKRQTIKSEVFSIAAIMLALFNGDCLGAFHKEADAFLRENVLKTVRERCNEPDLTDNVPLGARSFVLNMLKFDADERYTPQRALENAWLTKTCPRRQTSGAAGCFAGLKALFSREKP